MIDFVTGVFLTVRKTALCQERTSSIIAPLRLELPAPPALLPALDAPVQRTFSDTHSFSNVQELDLKTKLAALPTATLIDCCAANGIVAGTWTHAYSPDYRQDLIHALT